MDEDVLQRLIGSVESVLQGTGLFETVNGGEITGLSGNGYHAGVWLGYFEPAGKESGLDSVSLRVDLMARLYGPVHSMPVDEIDPGLMQALSVIGRAFLAGFSLGGLVRAIDVFGSNGQKMTGRAGYLDVQEGTRRVLTLTLPLIVDNVWNEVP